MSVWDKYPNLPPAEFRTLVAVAAQVLLEGNSGGDVSQELLQQSTRASARDLEPLLTQVDASITKQDVQALLEDEEGASRACRAVLDQVRGYPELAQRVAEEYEARQQKMTGVEVVLLAGALVVLAMRIKHVRIGSFVLDFDPANDAVKTFVAGLVKAGGGG